MLRVHVFARDEKVDDWRDHLFPIVAKRDFALEQR